MNPAKPNKRTPSKGELVLDESDEIAPALSLWSPTRNRVHTTLHPHQLGVWWLAGVGGECAFNRD